MKRLVAHCIQIIIKKKLGHTKQFMGYRP